MAGCPRSTGSAGRLAARLPGLALLVVLVALNGCASVSYYAHVVRGEVSLLARREPIARAIGDQRLDAHVRERLRDALAARRFASERLGLPRNRSYASFVQLDRPYVTWSVFAAPEFSVEPVEHCFPFAGCVGYLGYFERERAARKARELERVGYDTAVRGVAAYSTLGWFADPIVSSMLRGGQDDLDRVIFHELAHQKLYVRDDTTFNESYASFVANEGLREWLAANGRADGAADVASDRDDAFTRLVLDLRERLRALYAVPQADAIKRVRKAAEIDAFRARYVRLRDREWNGDRRYDAWVDAPINNASLVPFGLYDSRVGAFAALFAAAKGDWAAFHARARELAQLPREERERRLAALQSAAPAP